MGGYFVVFICAFFASGTALAAIYESPVSVEDELPPDPTPPASGAVNHTA